MPGSVLTMKIPKEIKLSCKPNETNIYSISALQRKGTKELMTDVGRYLEQLDE